MKYFPYLRGKQNELLALRAVASEIAQGTKVVPIIEPIKLNNTTMISLDRYVEADMPFVFVTNPSCGSYAGEEEKLYEEVFTNGPLGEYENFIPALCVGADTRIEEAERFVENYNGLVFAVIYKGKPKSASMQRWCLDTERIYYHIILEGKVPAEFYEQTPKIRRVMIRDNFNRQARNADYPPIEHFADLNHDTHWGDYSIQGDHYSESGGPAYAVAVHHIHLTESSTSLEISHYLSNRQATTDDVSGKVIEAVTKLVEDFDELVPSDTSACSEYREMAESEQSRGLGYLKRLAIQHHLEVMLGND